jgi:hypothetical protein
LENTCNQVLAHCLAGERVPDELLDRSLEVEEGRAFLSIVVERLGDLFEPRLCDVYEDLFPRVIQRVYADLMPRVRRFHKSPVAPASPARVYVLSRVTLGADIAVTSVFLDAAKKRYPGAEILFVGPKKNFELFEADPRIRYFPAPYPRSSSLRDRLGASAALQLEDGLVIDPDSRLTQLGLISICEDDRYFLFPSRRYGGEELDRLPDLASRWAQEIFGVEDARPYIAPLPVAGPPAEITVSLGVGENASKRIEGTFERELLRLLAGTGASILVDKGAGAEERARVEGALQPGMRTHDGAFAPFAAEIARSKLFVGYDSAGGHVASACGVPLISIANGFASERMLARWRPNGTLIRGDQSGALEAVKRALTNTP